MDNFTPVKSTCRHVLFTVMFFAAVLAAHMPAAAFGDDTLVGIGAREMNNEVTTEDIEALIPEMEDPFEIDIMFDKTPEHIGPEESAKWRGKKNGRSIWHDEPIIEYLENLGKKYDNGDKVRFVSHKGKTLEIESSTCGWKLNTALTLEALKTAVENNEKVMQPCWNSGLKYTPINDVGLDYAEVDLSEQKVYLFLGGKLVFKTDCVTGYPNIEESATQPGVFQILEKHAPFTLKGENYDGSKYEQDVSYWIPFNGGQGFHDAPWRYEFGGQIYLTHGSHGCVNLPVESAKTIYEAVYMYFPVIVY